MSANKQTNKQTNKLESEVLPLMTGDKQYVCRECVQQPIVSFPGHTFSGLGMGLTHNLASPVPSMQFQSLEKCKLQNYM